MKRRAVVKMLAIAASVAAIGATSSSALAQQKTVKVGVLHSLSGTMAISETVLKDMALMAIDEINAKGGVMGKQARAGRRRSGVELAAVRREGAPAPHAGQGRRRVRLLDFGVAQVGAAGVRGAERPAVLPGAVRRRRAVEERVLHRRRAQPAGDSRGRVPDEQGRRRRQALRLLGTDYVYPRTTNKILRAFLKSKGVADKDIDEKYTPFGHSDYQTIVADIKKFAAGGKTAVVSTINGDSNVPFYKELGNQGLKATDVPVVAFSVGEEELRGVDTKPLVGHLAAWNYFMSLKSPANDEFKKKWAAYAKAKKLAGHKDKPLTNDPMEATYIGIYMWKQAVEKAKTLRRRQGDRGDGAARRSRRRRGFTSKMDEKNHHLHKPVFIGEVKADGQFNVVWKTKGPVKAQPWSPFIAGNDKKKDEPALMARRRSQCSQCRHTSGAAKRRLDLLSETLIPIPVLIASLALELCSRARSGRGRASSPSATATKRSRRSRALVAEGDPNAARAAEGARRGRAADRPASRSSSCAATRRSTRHRQADRAAHRTAEDVVAQQPPARRGRRARSARSSSPPRTATCASPRRAELADGARERCCRSITQGAREGDRSRDRGLLEHDRGGASN